MIHVSAPETVAEEVTNYAFFKNQWHARNRGNVLQSETTATQSDKPAVPSPLFSYEGVSAWLCIACWGSAAFTARLAKKRLQNHMASCRWAMCLPCKDEFSLANEGFAVLLQVLLSDANASLNYPVDLVNGCIFPKEVRGRGITAKLLLKGATC